MAQAVKEGRINRQARPAARCLAFEFMGKSSFLVSMTLFYAFSSCLYMYSRGILLPVNGSL